MLDQIVRLNEEQLVFVGVMAGIAMAAVTVMAAVATVQFRKLRERQLDLGFKEDLLRRGLSVDEAVRLLTVSRPSWSQSMMSVGDWMILRVSGGFRNAANSLSRVRQPTQRFFRHAGREGSQLCRVAWREGRYWGRRIWRDGGQWCRSLWREARPYVRWSMASLNRCVHWLGDQTDRLVRRLAPHRP